MEELVLFLLSFLLIFIIYQLFIVRKAKKNHQEKNHNKEPLEIMYLQKKYHIDLKKISYNQLLQIISIVSSFDISCVVSIILLVKNFWLELLFGFLSIFLLIWISYYFVYLFYKKKGMICNE